MTTSSYGLEMGLRIFLLNIFRARVVLSSLCVILYTSPNEPEPIF